MQNHDNLLNITTIWIIQATILSDGLTLSCVTVEFI